MAYIDLLIHSVVILTPGASLTSDRYNNPVPGGDVTTNEKARIQEKTTEELLALRDTQIGKFDFFGVADSAITGLSRVQWGSRMFRVTGQPNIVDGRYGPHHVEASLEEILGA